MCIVLLFKKGYAVFRPAAMVFFDLFFVFTFVIVAQWDWDNIKILLWLYFLISGVLWRIWISRLSWKYTLAVGIIIFFSGTIAVVSSLPGNNGGKQLYQTSELWESKSALMGLPADAVLATAPDPNHPTMFWVRRWQWGIRVIYGRTALIIQQGKSSWTIYLKAVSFGLPWHGISERPIFIGERAKRRSTAHLTLSGGLV